MTDSEFSNLARGVCADCGGYVANKRALRCANCNRIKRRSDKDAKKSETCKSCGKAGTYTRGLCRTCARMSPCPECGTNSRRDRPCPRCKYLYVAPASKRHSRKRETCKSCGRGFEYLKDGVCAKCRKLVPLGEFASFIAAGHQIRASVVAYLECDGEPCCTLRLPCGKLLYATPIEGLTITKEMAA